VPATLCCILGCQRREADPKESDLLRLAPDDSGGPGVIGATPTIHEVGSTARARDYTLSVRSVKVCGADPVFRPPPGVIRVGVEVQIAGLSEHQVPVNPFYAMVVAPSGQRFEATLAGCKPGLRAQRVTGGVSAQGWVSFDVPAQHGTHLTFTYSPVVIGVGREELRFALDG
jgi:hypothetical protein